MNAILPKEKALDHCYELMNELDSSDIGNQLMFKGNGRMFGVLTCTDGTILRAFSGELLGHLTYPGFVPPVFDVHEMQRLLDESDKKIKLEHNQEKRTLISREYWEKIKQLYKFTCFDGSVRNLSELFVNAPAGTGDCCAPRLLSYCFSLGKKPQSLAEFYYGNGSFEHKSFHNPCDERCKPILKHIIGLDILFQDKDIVVVNKPSGLLAIEGKTEFDCVASRVRNFFPDCIQQPCIHRLDQATSGLMVLGLSQKAHDILSNDFEERQIYKEYTALVEGKIYEDTGVINLPIRLDTDNRPHQIVDFEKGKNAKTQWHKIKIQRFNGKFGTRLLLIPETGRTHQLRVHCAYGLKHPIFNDALYGDNKEGNLTLHASKLRFIHPISGKEMCFESKPDF